MRVEPASHASHASHHVSHARQIPSPFSFLRLLAAFGNLARVFAILTLLSISFCYLPSYFSSFFMVSYVITGLPVQPSHKMGFPSSAAKNGLPGEGRHEGLVPRNDVLTNGFI